GYRKNIAKKMTVGSTKTKPQYCRRCKSELLPLTATKLPSLDCGCAYQLLGSSIPFGKKTGPEPVSCRACKDQPYFFCASAFARVRISETSDCISANTLSMSSWPVTIRSRPFIRASETSKKPAIRG